MNVVIHPANLKADALPSENPSMSLVRRVLFGVTVVAALGVGAWLGWEYWTVWRFEETTDDAYVQADIVAIAPQVAGYLASVAVSDNQHVNGDILATIDPRDYQAAVDQVKTDVAGAEAAIESNEAQLREQQALIDEATATLDADRAAAHLPESRIRLRRRYHSPMYAHDCASKLSHRIGSNESRVEEGGVQPWLHRPHNNFPPSMRSHRC